MALWCAESRKQRLAKRNVAGDLPLAYTDEAKWTLERLHLCEHPPRFPQVLFKFASDAIEDGTGPHSEIARVASILRKHPTLRVRIHGYAQPDAPPSIGEALAQARATSVRHALLLQLADVPEFADEDPEEGGTRSQPVHASPQPLSSAPHSRLPSLCASLSSSGPQPRRVEPEPPNAPHAYHRPQAAGARTMGSLASEPQLRARDTAKRCFGGRLG